MHTTVYVCVYVCMYVCMYTTVYVCVYVCSICRPMYSGGSRKLGTGGGYVCIRPVAGGGGVGGSDCGG